MAENQRVLLRLADVKMHFPLKRTSFFQKEQKVVKAVDGVTVDIYQGETFGLVGESGCGKSTLGRVILQLLHQTTGSVRYLSASLDEFAPAYVRKVTARIARLQERDPQQLLDCHMDCVRIAGGLLAHADRQAVSQAIRAKHSAVAEWRRAKEDANTLKIQCEALASEGTDRKKIKACREKLTARQAAEGRLLQSVRRCDEALSALRAACAEDPAYPLLQAHADDSVDLSRLTTEEMRVLRSDLQMVFQDPYASLNPRLTVGQLISEGLVAHQMFTRGSDQLEKYTLDIMDKCGLQPYMLHRYPHQFSGGQRQRIGIARSLALMPKFVVCDEAVSALDVSIQSQIINLLMDLKQENNLTYLFISHDLSAVKFISDRIAVMYLGNIIELGSAETIFAEPLHPYTEALIDAIPTTEDEANRELQVIEGDIPSPIDPPPGCKFHTRCKYATDKCRSEVPVFQAWRKGHSVACHYPLREYGL